MTVSVQQTFTASVASGSTTVFPYSFKVAHEDDLSVMLDGVLQTTGYSVTGVGDDAGGDVVFDVAPTSGVKVLRYLAPVLNRQTDYQQFGDWTASVVNRDFDRLWLALQAISQDTARSLKLPVDTSESQEITADASERANKSLHFDDDGNLVLNDFPSNPEISAIAAAASAAEAAASAASVDVANLLTKAGNLSGLASPAAARSNLGLDESTQAEMIAGTETALRAVSPLRCRQGADAAVAAGLAAYEFHDPLLTQAVSASGQTSIELLDIPEWATEVIVILSAISTSAAVFVLVQIGSDAALNTTSYQSVSGSAAPGGVGSSYKNTGFHTAEVAASYETTAVFSLLKTAETTTTNITCAHSGMSTNGTTHYFDGGGGFASTSGGVLGRVKVSVPSGTFDGGTVAFLLR